MSNQLTTICDNCWKAFQAGYEEAEKAYFTGLDAENARLREQVSILEAGRCTSCMEPINPLHQQCACSRAEFEMLYHQLNETDTLRTQAEALAEALDEQDAVRVTPYEVDLAVKMFNRNGGRWESESDEELVMKWEWRKRNAIELAIVALRAYREATP